MSAESAQRGWHSRTVIKILKPTSDHVRLELILRSSELVPRQLTKAVARHVMLRASLLLLALVAPASAQFGRRNIQRDKPQQQGGGAKDMNDVDLAMAGWEQLSKNPGKMQEVMESLKDPEVMAKAQEMLKDPVYMEAARKKVNELQAKAQQRGLIAPFRS